MKKPDFLFLYEHAVREYESLLLLKAELERRGYAAPAKEPEGESPKKAVPRAPQGNSSPGRGSGSTVSRAKTETTTSDKAVKVSEIPTVKGRLAALRAASEGMKGKTPQQHTHTTPPKTR